MIAIVVAGKRLQLARENAVAVVDYLWKGLERGAVTAAARLGNALDEKHGGDSSVVEFPEYETLAVQDALETLGINEN
jgi:hypothetical protein